MQMAGSRDTGDPPLRTRPEHLSSRPGPRLIYGLGVPRGCVSSLSSSFQCIRRLAVLCLYKNPIGRWDSSSHLSKEETKVQTSLLICCKVTRGHCPKSWMVPPSRGPEWNAPSNLEETMSSLTMCGLDERCHRGPLMAGERDKGLNGWITSVLS